MKITVRRKNPEKKKAINPVDISTGTIFEFDDKTIGLKLHNEEIVLLNYVDGSTWCELASGYKTEPVTKILGRLSEIIVEEE